MCTLPAGNKDSEIISRACQIWLKEMIALDGREKPRFGSEIAGVKDCPTRTFNQEPSRKGSRRTCKIGKTRTNMTEPGQWFASIRVIVTVSLSEMSNSVGVLSGIACCRACRCHGIENKNLHTKRSLEPVNNFWPLGITYGSTLRWLNVFFFSARY